MATKTKLPEGMADLLDRIGRDTKTARLCVAGDYPAAKTWVDTVMGMVPVTIPVLDDKGDATGEREATGEMEHGLFAFLERIEGDVRPTRSNETNKPRAQAYTALLSMLNELVTA